MPFPDGQRAHNRVTNEQLIGRLKSPKSTDYRVNLCSILAGSTFASEMQSDLWHIFWLQNNTYVAVKRSF